MSNKQEGEKMTKPAKINALVPTLRFPEFRDTAEWEEKKLIDVVDKAVKWSFIGGPFGSNLKSSDFVNEGIRVIQLQNIGDGDFVDDYRIFTSEGKADELLSNNIYPGDIILSKMGDPVGRACFVPDFHNRYVMCSDGIRLVVNEKCNNKYFIYLLINSRNFRPLVEKTATGSTRKRIGLDELKNLPVLLPKMSEQQKIANCFAFLDARITLEAQQLDTLKTHKKGLMKQLFPAPGETLPRLRFPEFREAGEWKEISISQIAKLYKGKGISKSDIVADGKQPCIRYGELYTVYGDVIDNVVSNTNLPSCDLFLSEKNDVIIPSSGETKIDIATAACVIREGIALGSDLNVIRSSQNGIFLSYSLNGSLSDAIAKIAQGDSVVHLYANQLKLLDLSIPSKDEQRKIAECLTSLDDLIAAQSKRLDKLKTHKQGLLQQLFPSLEVVGA